MLAGEGQAYISVLRMLCHEEGVTCSWDLSGWCPITIFHLALDRASLTSSSSICAFQDCSRMPPAAVMLCAAYLPMPSSGLEKVSALGTEQTQPALSWSLHQIVCIYSAINSASRPDEMTLSTPCSWLAQSLTAGSLAGILLALTLAQKVNCVRCWRDELTFIHRPHCCLIFLHKGAGIYEEHINLAIGQRERV